MNYTIEHEPRQHSREFRNSPLDGEGFDTDRLTADELIDAGYKLNRERHKQAVKQRCTSCKKPVNNPVTSFKVKGLEILEPGESVHEGCARRRYEALIKLLKGMKEDEE